MQAIWDSHTAEASQRNFITWLPSFYDELAAAAESEFRWTATNLPDQHPGIVLLLLKSFFSRIDKSFRSHLATALAQGAPRQQHSQLVELSAALCNNQLDWKNLILTSSVCWALTSNGVHQVRHCSGQFD